MSFKKCFLLMQEGIRWLQKRDWDVILPLLFLSFIVITAIFWLFGHSAGLGIIFIYYILSKAFKNFWKKYEVPSTLSLLTVFLLNYITLDTMGHLDHVTIMTETIKIWFWLFCLVIGIICLSIWIEYRSDKIELFLNKILKKQWQNILLLLFLFGIGFIAVRGFSDPTFWGYLDSSYWNNYVDTKEKIKLYHWFGFWSAVAGIFIIYFRMMYQSE